MPRPRIATCDALMAFAPAEGKEEELSVEGGEGRDSQFDLLPLKRQHSVLEINNTFTHPNEASVGREFFWPGSHPSLAAGSRQQAAN